MSDKIKIISRTQVYLDDPEFFCNKSWTLSFNFNTKSWVSFHSYIPNWYIGENNFFYSGINGCCDDTEVSFDLVAGVVNREITTTTTTTNTLITTTTSTTIFTADCELIGTGYVVDCALSGTAIITTPSTPTTTLCQKPLFLTPTRFFYAYTPDGGATVNFTSDSEAACVALQYVIANFTTTQLNYFSAEVNMITPGVYEVGQTIYDSTTTQCSYIQDGWYFDTYSFVSNNVYHVVGGLVVEIVPC